jgi:dihydroflavonol-4-reductase
MNSVFLSGAGGMLGNSILRELLRRNYFVTALYRPGERISDVQADNFKPVVGDLLEGEKIISLTSGCNFIIHAAASTTVWPRRHPLTIEVNLKGTQNLVKAAQQHKVKRFVHIGTANSFAPGSKQNPGCEKNTYDGEKFGMDYMDSKYHAQQFLLKEFREKQFPFVSVNPTFMIGPYDFGPSSGKMILALYGNKIPGYSEGGKSFVCSKDVAVAAVNGLTMGKEGECYIAGGENLTYQEFFRKVSEVMNKPFRLKKIPGSLVLAYGFFNSVLSRITRKAPVLSYGMAKIGNIEQFYSSDKIRNELQMPATPIENGIKECLTWFKENNYC